MMLLIQSNSLKMRYTLLLSLLIILLSCNDSSEKKATSPDSKSIVHQIAEANGVENFNKVQMIEFTFNVQRDTAKPSNRQWQWFPKSNEVVFITDSATTKFTRYDTTTQELKKLNARFTNDEYWLLYPFHLKWDTGFEYFDSSMQSAPVSGKNLRRISIKYNNTDGFTPGDRYDIYVDEKLRIHEWAFHNKGVAEPSLITTWDNYADFKEMQMAQEHKSKDGKFRLWFTDIHIR